MLYDIQKQGGVAKIGEFITKVKDKNSSVKLMGFGHRVYKNYDPRAKLMRETCHEVLNELGLHDDPLFELAMTLEKIALEDEYFVSRKLYPNVDFYSGHRAEGDRHPGAAVHGDLRAGAHGRLDRAAERDDRRSGVQDRPAAPALRRRHPADRHADRAADLKPAGRPGGPAAGAVVADGIRPHPGDRIGPFEEGDAMGSMKEFESSSTLFGSNVPFIEELYEHYLADANAVSPEWRAYFDELRGDAADVAHAPVIASFVELARNRKVAGAMVDAATMHKQVLVLRLISKFRTLGMFYADLDPLQAARAAVPARPRPAHLRLHRSAT